MSKIDSLKEMTPQGRAEALEQQFQKNKAFFQKNYPEVAPFLGAGAAPFHINVTDDFLTIVNTENGELCHPEVGLDLFAQKLGDWTHKAWIDLIDGTIYSFPDHGYYSQFPVRFQKKMLESFPGLIPRMEGRQINLPELANGKHFSNPVVFYGVFHGLHIDHYLSRTQLACAAFVEPEPARFVLSCYFLDYQSFETRFERLILHIGPGLPENFVDLFFRQAKVSSGVWTRILPGYPSPQLEEVTRSFRLKWRSRDVWMPQDWRIKGMENAYANITGGDLIWGQHVSLSSKSRIAVVGAGPSLSNDLEWLAQHQDQFVIFSVHSAVSALRTAGIKADFQFTLDINPWDEEIFQRVQLDPSVPVVTSVNDFPDKFQAFDEVFRIVQEDGVNPFQMKNGVPFLVPTSGNMALAFACWCKPSQIYLFGLDFGFRESTKTHVAESSAYRNEDEHREIIGSGSLEVEANFSGAEKVYAQSYFNMARLCAEVPIAVANGEVKVFNCSDGARLCSATPCRSYDIEARDYCKEDDLRRIKEMFLPLVEGVHWDRFALTGAFQLEAYKAAMVKLLKMKKFNWLKFVDKIDHFYLLLQKQLPNKVAKNTDPRIIPYVELIVLLFDAWYRFLCFTNTEEEWGSVYDKGYAELCKLVEEMFWPEGLN